VPIVWKSGSLNFLEPTGAVKVCTGITYIFISFRWKINPVCPLLNLCVPNVCDLTETEYGFPVSSQILQNAMNFRRRNWICRSDTHARYRALKLWLPHILIPEALLRILSFICRLHIFLVSSYYFNPLFLCNIFFFTKSGVFFFLKIHPLGIVEILTTKLTVVAVLPFPLHSKWLFVGYIRRSA
jgi:hypothetical protein